MQRGSRNVRTGTALSCLLKSGKTLFLIIQRGIIARKVPPRKRTILAVPEPKGSEGKISQSVSQGENSSHKSINIVPFFLAMIGTIR